MKKIFIAVIFVWLVSGCIPNKKVDGVYRYYMGKNKNFDIWIIDGNRVREKIYKEFLYGGNEHIYLTLKVRYGSTMRSPAKNMI